MINEDIIKKLFELRDESYCDFQSKLIPNVNKADFIGVRTPQMRLLAKGISKREDVGDFLKDVPHKYFDENQLHAFIISLIRDYDRCIAEVERFLPYVDNWATCDQMSPKVFKNHKQELLIHIKRWIKSEKTYTVRFAAGMLMQHYLDGDFRTEYARTVAAIRSDEYYVNMMVAWYFATALAKQYDEIIPFIEGHKLSPWTHNKAIQKSIESRRISPERKEYLRSLKV